MRSNNGKTPLILAVAMWRVSSNEQRQGYSLDSQERNGRKYAKRHRLDLVKEWRVSESGFTDGRTQMRALIEYVKSHREIGAIVFEKSDRLGRRFPEFLELRELVETLGVQLHLFKAGRILHPDSPASDWFFQNMDIAMAQFASENLSQEVRKGHLEKSEQGKYPFHPPFGYRTDKELKIIVPDRNYPGFDVFVQLAHTYAEGKVGLGTIVERAYEQGLRSKKGNKISKNSWWRYFQYPAYAGRFDCAGRRWDGTYEKLWSWETHQALLRVLRGKAAPRKTHYGASEAIAFRGMGRCSWSECPNPGAALMGDGPKKGNPELVYYRCCRHSKPSIRQDRLAAQLGETLEELTIPQDVVRDAVAQLRADEGQHDAERAAQQGRLNTVRGRLEQRVDAAYGDKIDGAITAEQWRRHHDRWSKEIEEIDTQLARLEGAGGGFLGEGAELLELSQFLAPAYVAANNQEKREILEIAISNFAWDGANLAVTWASPFDTLSKSHSCRNWYTR